MAVDGVQSIGSSSIGSLLFQALAASGSFSISQATQTQLTNLQEVQSTVATRLTDLADLRELLVDLKSAAAGLRPASTTTGSNVDVDKTDDASNLVKLDRTDSDTAGLQTGDKVTFSTSFYGVTSSTSYFIKIVSQDANTTDVRLYANRTDAINDNTASAVNITTTDNSVGAINANQIIPEPEDEIEAFVNAYNNVQEFLAERRQVGGSSEDDRLFSTLGAKLLDAFRPALESNDLSPAITLSGESREIEVDSTSLATQVASNAQDIASVFDKNGDNVAGSIRDIADLFVSTIDARVHTLNQQSPELNARIDSLLDQSIQEQTNGFNNIGRIAGAISQTQVRIQFLSALAG